MQENKCGGLDIENVHEEGNGHHSSSFKKKKDRIIVHK